MHHLRVTYGIPTKAVPQLPSSLAASVLRDSSSDVTFTRVNWHRTIKENVDSMSAFATFRNSLDVLGISCSHRPVCGDDLHRLFAHHDYASRFILCLWAETRTAERKVDVLYVKVTMWKRPCLN